jgi:hypothetical protein
VFNIRSVPRNIEPHGLPDHRFERRDMTGGGPELELGVTVCPELNEIVVAPIVNLKRRERL